MKTFKYGKESLLRGVLQIHFIIIIFIVPLKYFAIR
jgi:hypothetical protein